MGNRLFTAWTYGMGLIMWILYMQKLGEWWGATGYILGFFVAPLCAVFPIVLPFTEGWSPFTQFYVGIWVVSILGGILIAHLSKDSDFE